MKLSCPPGLSTLGRESRCVESSKGFAEWTSANLQNRPVPQEPRQPNLGSGSAEGLVVGDPGAQITYFGPSCFYQSQDVVSILIHTHPLPSVNIRINRSVWWKQTSIIVHQMQNLGNITFELIMFFVRPSCSPSNSPCSETLTRFVAIFFYFKIQIKSCRFFFKAQEPKPCGFC